MGILAHLTRGFRVCNTFEMMKKNNPIQYRNKVDFNINGNDIDAGSLWRLIGEKLILVDDDNFVESELDLDIFEKVN